MPPILFWRDVKPETKSRFQSGVDYRGMKLKQQSKLKDQCDEAKKHRDYFFGTKNAKGFCDYRMKRFHEKTSFERGRIGI